MSRPSATIYSARSAAVEQANLRATAWGVVAAGVAAPLVRKRVQAPPVLIQTVALRRAGWPVRRRAALACARRGGVRSADVGVSGRVQVARTTTRAAQAQRVHIDYPIVADRALGLGELPTLRLQRALARRGPQRRAQWRALDRVLVWAHWMWFMVPHGIARVHPGTPSGAFPARGGDDLRRVRHRRERLLAGCRPRRRGMRRRWRDARDRGGGAARCAG